MSSREPNLLPRYGAMGLFFCLLGLNLLFFHGKLETSDEITMAATTASLVERGSLYFAQTIYGREFSGYGIGTSLMAIPSYLLDRLFVGSLGNASLIPLTGGLLWALLGLTLAGFLEGSKRWGAVALVMATSPLFPASLTLYSEIPTALGLALAGLGLWRSTDNKDQNRWMILAFCGALLAVLCRMSAGPMLLFVLVWGWRLGADRRALLALCGGTALGVCVTAAINWQLRGSPLDSGYGNQNFTSPILTGLHGLLVSPERGLLIFFPVVLFPLICWNDLGGKARSLTMLGWTSLGFTMIFHARFWTWHGGWTIGPRFLLPGLTFLVPVLAECLIKSKNFTSGKRLALIIGLIWSGFMAYIYARHSAIGWWNQLWGYHQLENQWLFMPQLSLWRAWWEGYPLPFQTAELGGTSLFFSILGGSLIIGALYPLYNPFRGYVGTDPEAADELKRLLFPSFPAWTWFTAAGFVLLFAVVPMLKGPRGWQVVDSQQALTSPEYMMLEGETGRFQGILDYPLSGKMTLIAKANALYRVKVDFDTVMERTEPMPQNWNNAVISVDRNKHLIEVEVDAKDDDPRFHLYWTWGGEGEYLGLAGGDYLLPRELTLSERFFTEIWRRRYRLSAGILALLLLIGWVGGGRSESFPESDSELAKQ